MARAAVTYGGEVAALRAAATVKSRLRRALADRAVRLGPVWLGGQRTGEIAALATRGLDGLDSYFARYLRNSCSRPWYLSRSWPGWPSRTGFPR